MANKKSLPNGCYYSLHVSPVNWDQSKAKTINGKLMPPPDPKKEWYIFYRFYEPGNKPYPVYVRGMNETKVLKEKQELTKALLEDEIRSLENGYNPNRKEVVIHEASEINEHTLFIDALQWSFNRIKVEPHTREDIKSALKYVIQAVRVLKYDYMNIGEVERKHILMILDKCEAIKETFTSNTYNHYRKYLSILFTELVIYQAIKHNPIDKYLPKRKVEKKPKKILSKDERQPLHKLKDLNYPFYRFINIFFHSARRTTEMLAVKKEHVDLRNQRFQILMKKGKGDHVWTNVTIEDSVLHYWKELINEAKDGEYLFSEGLKPGVRKIRTEQIKRRWNVWVKGKLGITATFYSLKHARLDELAATQGIEAAQKAAGHSSKVITMNYAVNEKEREHQRRKSQGGEL